MVNLTRTGTCGAVGIASGFVEKNMPQSLALAGQNIKYATILELVATLGGAALQFFSPYTLPDVVDGAVDGGITLLAKRGTANVLAGMAAPYAGNPMNGALGSPCAGRPLMGSYSGSQDRTKIV